MENKRKKPRVKTNLVVSFKAQNSRLAGGSRVKDISEIGVCILSKHFFAAGSLIELEIRSDDLENPVKALARVVRVANRNDGRYQFEVGLEFLNIPITALSVLQGYVNRTIAQGGNQDVHWLD